MGTEYEAMPLPEQEVHLWLAHCFDARHDERVLSEYDALLNPEEAARRQRFRRTEDQRRYLIARVLVRYTLSRYAHEAPAAWRFVRGPHDKPEIERCAMPLRFNLSHSGDWAVCAVALQHDVGVDIEWTRRVNDVLSIARHYFSASEQCALNGLERGAARDRFFDLWTLKESFMKARGEGISLGLGNFSFDLADRDQQALNIGVRFAEVLRDDPSAWRFWLLSPVPDYRLALAWHRGVTHGDTVIRLFHTVPGHRFDEASLPLRGATV